MSLGEFMDMPDDNLLPRKCNIVFVCVGNINRSPACETILKYFIIGSDLEWSVTSAAISDKNKGKLSSKKMRDTLDKFGYPYKEIRSKPLTQEMVNAADVIYIMDNANKKKMIENFGEKILSKLRFVGEIDSSISGIYVSDPHFSKGVEEHEKVVYQIEQRLDKLVTVHKKLYS